DDPARVPRPTGSGVQWPRRRLRRQSGGQLRRGGGRSGADVAHPAGQRPRRPAASGPGPKELTPKSVTFVDGGVLSPAVFFYPGGERQRGRQAVVAGKVGARVRGGTRRKTRPSNPWKGKPHGRRA